MLQGLLKSKFMSTLGAVLILLILFYFGKQWHKKYLIDQEIRGLEQEISDLEGKNEEILQLISYFETAEFKERQARSLLNLQKPEEFAVALPGDEETAVNGTQTEEQKASNFKHWWNYFFNNQ